MLIRSTFDIQFHLPNPAVVIALLHLHPSLDKQLRSADELLVEYLGTSPLAGREPRVAISPSDYTDSFGNICSRFVSPTGHLRLSSSNLIQSEDQPEKSYPDAKQASIDDLPPEVLQFLLPSRYCEVDRFGAIANELFGVIPAGWTRATAIRDWVHEKVIFNYNAARPTKTAMDVFTERVGVCRDFQHLAIALSRCQNIPARYVTGYIGDIRMPYSGPGDFSAWYQVFLDGQWISLDARHNYPRIGRILMATGRDAADVAITTSFGAANLTYFYVDSWEVDAEGNRIPLPEGDRTNVVVPITPGESNRPTQTNASQTSPIQTQAATT
jgi:transglutaminase-like putative cysteine protease